MGCSDESGSSPLEVTVQRTTYGIPHIRAADFKGAGAGLGYAQAQDHICTLADQIVKVRSERAKVFGRGEADANVESDFAYLALGVRAQAKSVWGEQSADARDLISGFVAGYNHYLAVTPRERLPEPCRGAAWVAPIDVEDLTAYHLDLALRGSGVRILASLGKAQPPGASTADFRATKEPLHVPDLGSNGWAIGRDRADGGHGMLVANPHFPWEGELRLYESHMTVPGKMDVYGASLLGIPIINIGFNRHLGWTHTVARAHHMTFYRLRLAPGDPTSYVVDGAARKMSQNEHSVEVREADGTMTRMTRTLWRSHYGPMIRMPGLDWSTDTAFTYRDANEGNGRGVETWLRMGTAETLDQLEAAQRDVHGIPWVFTVAADDRGQALFVDASRVPNMSPATHAAFAQSAATDPLVRTMIADYRVFLLDGSTSRDEWVDSGERGAPGLVPVKDAPRRLRTDFVMNSNDAPWLANPFEPLVDYPNQYGSPRFPSSPRTRMNLLLLTEQGESSAAGADGRFTRPELERAIFSNRSFLAEQWRAGVAERCQGVADVDVGGGRLVPIAEACAVLARWDGRYDLDREGAPLWREFLARFPFADMSNAGGLFHEPFNPDEPLTTPRGLVPAPGSGPDPLLVALGKAVDVLQKAGFGATSTLGQVQWTSKGVTRVPIHGGIEREGVVNIASYDPAASSTLLPKMGRGDVLSEHSALTKEGYPINTGTSFVMVTEFTGSGPRATALLSYSQSADPESPHFADQTSRFSEKAWRPVLFDAAEIDADPNLKTTKLTVPQ